MTPPCRRPLKGQRKRTGEPKENDGPPGLISGVIRAGLSYWESVDVAIRRGKGEIRLHKPRIVRAALSPEMATAGTPPPGVVQCPARKRLLMGVR
jgi:hypothetical protein